MSDRFWLTEAKMKRLRPFVPKSHGKPRVDDRCVLSGIVFINCDGSLWRGSRWPTMARRRHSLGAMERERCLRADAGGTGPREWRNRHLDDRRHTPEDTSDRVEPRAEEGGLGHLFGGIKGGLNSKLHAVTDAVGRPIRLFLSGGQTGDCIGAPAMVCGLPKARTFLANRGYDADRFRKALNDREFVPCIPSRRGRKTTIPPTYPARGSDRRAEPPTTVEGAWGSTSDPGKDQPPSEEL